MIAPLLMVWAACQSGQSKGPGGMLGADGALKRIAAQSATYTRSDPFGTARAESDALLAQLPKISAAQAAQSWVHLMQAWEAASPSRHNPNDPDQWGEIVMAVLPEPASWPIIRDQLAHLPPTAKRKAAVALMDDLLGHDEEVLRYLEGKRDPEKVGLKEDVFNPDHLISDAEQPIAERVGNLDLLEKVIILRTLGDRILPWDPKPNYVQLFGKDRAGKIIKQLLQSPSATGSPSIEGKEAQDLARSIVLANLPTIKSPPWSLVRGFEDSAFVFALVNRFGEEGFTNTGNTHSADLVYGLTLAKRGDMPHALKFLGSMDGTEVDIRTFVKPGEGQVSLFGLVSKLMSSTPVDSLWPLYQQLGRSLGRIDEVEARLTGWLSSHPFTEDRLPIWLDRKADFDLAKGRIREAISGYEQAIGLKFTDPAYKLLEVASLVGDQQAVDFVATASKGMGTQAIQLNLFRAYVDQGRISDAQRAILDAAANVHNVNLEAEGHGRLLNADPTTGAHLAELYYLEDQPKEILSLLREYPRWGADDLSGLIKGAREYGYYDYEEPNGIAFYAAWALARTGQKARAIQVLNAIDSKSKGSLDLLSQLEGKSASNKDFLAPAQTPIASERPNIAERYERVNAYASAIEFYQKALAADPSDASAAIGLARSLASLGKPSEAGAALRKAIDMAVVGHISKREEDPFSNWSYNFEGDEDQIRDQLSSLKASHPTNSRVWVAISDFDTTIGDFKGAVDSFETALAIDPKSIPALEGIAALWPKHVATLKQTREAVLKLIEIAPVTWRTYQSEAVYGAFSDKSALWPGYGSLKASGAASSKVSLFPLDASRKSLASGTRSINSWILQLSRQTPGTFIGDIPEVRALFP